MSATLTFDRELEYPSYEKPFRESWNGRFESVLVVLHPFFKVPAVRPVQDGYIVTRHSQSVLGKAAFHRAIAKQGVKSGSPELGRAVDVVTKGASLLAAIGHPEGTDWVSDAERVTWSEVADQSGLGTVERVGAALLGIIGGLRPEFIVRSDIESLVAYAEATFVFLPTEGCFQPLLFEPLAALFQTVGAQSIIYQREFDNSPVQSVSFADLIGGVPYRGSLYDDAKSVLAVVDWDSHFMLVSGPRETLERWRVDRAVDGFFADENTSHSWWLPHSNLN